MTVPHTFLPDLTGIEIPSEGTLSKVVYKDDQIRVVLFAFDAGEELTEHTAAMPAVVQVLTGRLHVTMGEAAIEMGTADWAHMAANLPHSVKALEPSVMVLMSLREAREGQRVPRDTSYASMKSSRPRRRTRRVSVPTVGIRPSRNGGSGSSGYRVRSMPPTTGRTRRLGTPETLTSSSRTA